jgi:hypothetical protein
MPSLWRQWRWAHLGLLIALYAPLLCANAPQTRAAMERLQEGWRERQTIQAAIFVSLLSERPP